MIVNIFFFNIHKVEANDDVIFKPKFKNLKSFQKWLYDVIWFLDANHFFWFKVYYAEDFMITSFVVHDLCNIRFLAWF